MVRKNCGNALEGCRPFCSINKIINKLLKGWRVGDQFSRRRKLRYGIFLGPIGATDDWLANKKACKTSSQPSTLLPTPPLSQQASQPFESSESPFESFSAELIKCKPWGDKLPWGFIRYDASQSGKVGMFAWGDNTVVLFATTVRDLAETVIRNRRRPAATRSGASQTQRVSGTLFRMDLSIPKLIDDYNHNMGAVDQFDQFRSYYSILRTHNKTWRPLFTLLIEIFLVNAYKLSTANKKTKHDHHPAATNLYLKERFQYNMSCDAELSLLQPNTVRTYGSCVEPIDTNLNNQRSEHKISHALNTILNWHSFWNPCILLNPSRIPVQWYYSRVIKRFIHGELEKRFEELKQERAVTRSDPSRKKKAKSVIALTLDAYITQKQEASKQPLESFKLEKSFAQIAANQIRLFIFAGNDTTATLIVYTYHVLAKYPAVLSKIREEHDKVFGSGNDAGSMLREQPALINLCRYTLAVVKETLRLYPPSSSLRDGLKGVSLVDQKGTIVPTEGLNATLMHYAIHTNPRVWPQPLEFLPERWLVEPGHELYPPAGAFRPFEQGMRNCIGQTLVRNELRTVLVMTVRKYAIKPAYDEWDAMALANESLFARTLRQWGLKSSPCKTVFGERAYMTSRAGAHPADGYPCRVEMVKG